MGIVHAYKCICMWVNLSVHGYHWLKCRQVFGLSHDHKQNLNLRTAFEWQSKVHKVFFNTRLNPLSPCLGKSF